MLAVVYNLPPTCPMAPITAASDGPRNNPPVWAPPGSRADRFCRLIPSSPWDIRTRFSHPPDQFNPPNTSVTSRLERTPKGQRQEVHCFTTQVHMRTPWSTCYRTVDTACQDHGVRGVSRRLHHSHSFTKCSWHWFSSTLDRYRQIRLTVNCLCALTPFSSILPLNLSSKALTLSCSFLTDSSQEDGDTYNIPRETKKFPETSLVSYIPRMRPRPPGTVFARTPQSEERGAK